MPQTDDFWTWVTDTVTELDRWSYYELLGVPEDADPQLVRDVYYGLVRRIHPDRHPRERDPARKNALVRLYARVGEAYRVLSQPKLRARYDRTLAEGETRLSETEKRRPDTATAPDPKTEHARALYDKGRELADRGDARGARAQWQLALGFEPRSKVLAEALAALDRGDATPVPPASGSADPAGTSAPAAAGAATPAAARGSALAELTASSTPTPVAAEASSRHGAPRRVRLRCSRWEQVAALYGREIQRGSMFLRAPRPLPVGAPVQLVLALPDGSQTELDAQVERSVSEGEKPGMGIRFTDSGGARSLAERLRAAGHDAR